MAIAIGRVDHRWVLGDFVAAVEQARDKHLARIGVAEAAVLLLGFAGDLLFVVAAFQLYASKVNLVALGLAFATSVPLIQWARLL